MKAKHQGLTALTWGGRHENELDEQSHGERGGRQNRNERLDEKEPKDRIGGGKMKAVLMSIRREHNANIESGEKGTELRTMPPPLNPPFRVYTYESGPAGRHKVVNEWICDLKTTWRMCMGVPAHLPKAACLPAEDIRKYSDGGRKDITELHISDLVIYDKPKELGEFCHPCKNGYLKVSENCKGCRYAFKGTTSGHIYCDRTVLNPPQSWCYVEEL